MKRWILILACVALLLPSSFAASPASSAPPPTPSGIYDNPDGTGPLGKGTAVILDDGTPFLKTQKIGDPPPTIGSPYNDWLFCANHTASISECYSCAERAYVNGTSRKLYLSAISACNLVEEFR